MATRIRNITKKVKSEIAEEVLTDRNIRNVIKGIINPWGVMHTVDAKIEILREENRIARVKASCAKFKLENPEGYARLCSSGKGSSNV